MIILIINCISYEEAALKWWFKTILTVNDVKKH